MNESDVCKLCDYRFAIYLFFIRLGLTRLSVYIRKINCSTPLQKLDKFKNELMRLESFYVDFITFFIYFSFTVKTLICFQSNPPYRALRLQTSTRHVLYDFYSLLFQWLNKQFDA